MSTLKQKAEAILQEKTEKIIPENFSNELEIFGVVGNIPTINNINKVVSSILDLEENNQTRFMSDMENNTNIICEPNTSIFLDCSNSDLANVIGLTANKIKKDETVLGITGTYEGEGSSSDYTQYTINVYSNSIHVDSYINGEFSQSSQINNIQDVYSTSYLDDFGFKCYPYQNADNQDYIIVVNNTAYPITYRLVFDAMGEEYAEYTIAPNSLINESVDRAYDIQYIEYEINK